MGQRRRLGFLHEVFCVVCVCQENRNTDFGTCLQQFKIAKEREESKYIDTSSSNSCNSVPISSIFCNNCEEKVLLSVTLKIRPDYTLCKQNPLLYRVFCHCDPLIFAICSNSCIFGFFQVRQNCVSRCYFL